MKEKKIEKQSYIIDDSRYLNRRNISYIISREKDRQKLIQGVCDNLIIQNGYYNSWIILFDDTGKTILSAVSGSDDNSRLIKNRLIMSDLPECAAKSLKSRSVIITDNPPVTCAYCPLSETYNGCGSITAVIEYSDIVYGVISISIPVYLIHDHEEQRLFKEISGDIAYALHNIKLEERRKHAEEALRKSEERYRTLQANIPIGIYRSTPEGKFLSVNPAMVAMLSYNSEEELLRVSAIDLYCEPERREELLKRLVIEHSVTNYEVRFYRKDRSAIWVSLSLHMIINRENNLVHLDGIANDITDKIKALSALRESEERYRKLVDRSPDLIALLHDGKIIFINESGIWHLGASNRDELLGRSFKEFIFITKDNIYGEMLKLLDKVTTEMSMAIDIKIKPLGKEPVDFEIHTSMVSFSGKNAIQIVGRDISKHKKLERILRETALSDELTGIPNRRKLFEHFELQWKLAVRNKQYISVIMVDIDYFKLYNDNYGHQSGDICLKKVASELSHVLSRPGDILGRYGGEEFLAVLPGTKLSGAKEVAEMMRQSIIDLKIEHKMSIVSPYITISIGVSTAMPDEYNLLTPEKLISMADRALYKSKEEGRNRISFEIL